jgi:hypothetical protein
MPYLCRAIWASRFAGFARSRRAIRSITFAVLRTRGARRPATVVPLLSLSLRAPLVRGGVPPQMKNEWRFEPQRGEIFIAT